MSVLEGIETPYGKIPEEELEKLAVLKQLVSTYYGVQKVRVGMGNRIAGILKEYGESDYTNRLVDIFNITEEIEKNILKHIKPILKEFEIYNAWLKHVKGVGEVLSAGLIAGIKTPSRFSNISKLWKYCGYHVENGKAPKRSASSKVCWSPFMKALCWKVGESFVKAGGYYRRVYEEFRKDEERKSEEGMIKAVEDCIGYVPKDPKVLELLKMKQPRAITRQNAERLRKNGITEIRVGMSNGHIYARAKRKTVKLFLAHLWQVWRELKGMDVTKPYANTILGHTDLINPPRTREDLK